MSNHCLHIYYEKINVYRIYYMKTKPKMENPSYFI